MANDIITSFKVVDENGIEKNAKVCYETALANKPEFKTINGKSIVKTSGDNEDNIEVEGGTAVAGNTIVDLTDYVNGDTLLPEVVEALKDEKTLVLYKLPDNSKILLTTRMTHGKAAPDEYILYTYTYVNLENNLLYSCWLEVNTINFNFSFSSEYDEYETTDTVNDKLSNKAEVIVLSSFSSGDTLPKGIVDDLVSLKEKAIIYHNETYYTFLSENSEFLNYMYNSTDIEEISIKGTELYIEKSTRKLTIDHYADKYIGVLIDDAIKDKMTVFDFTAYKKDDVLTEYVYHKIAADPKRVMLAVKDQEENTGNPVLMSYFGEDSNYLYFIGYYTTRSGSQPSNLLWSFLLRIVKSNRKLIFDRVRKYDLSILSPKAINHNNPYESYDDYENTNNHDIYKFSFNDNGLYRIKNYSSANAPEGENVQLYFNFGFGMHFTDTGRYISKESLDILKEYFPDYDWFSFGMDGQESCFIAYPPAFEVSIYFKVTDNEVEVFIGREE